MIEVAFPNPTHLLCVWHIQKNTIAKYNGYFEEKEDRDVFLFMWNVVVYVEVEEEFEETRLLFQVVFRENMNTITYTQNAWLLEN